MKKIMKLKIQLIQKNKFSASAQIDKDLFSYISGLPIVASAKVPDSLSSISTSRKPSHIYLVTVIITRALVDIFGTNNVLKFALNRNWYYNRKEIYRKFIHVKNIPCHVSGMTSGFSRLGKIRGIAIISSGNHFY